MSASASASTSGNPNGPTTYVEIAANMDVLVKGGGNGTGINVNEFTIYKLWSISRKKYAEKV